MNARPLLSFVLAIGCLAVGAAAPAVGCNGTGTTPVCDFPDGANNPEAGCGILIEASPGEGSVVDSAEEPVSKPVSDASADAADATQDSASSMMNDSSSILLDSSLPDAPLDVLVVALDAGDDAAD